MKHLTDWFSGATKLAAGLVSVVALSACMIISEQPLVDEAEATTPLPAKTYLFGYEEDGLDALKRNTEAPLDMTLNGKTYASSDGSINAMFVPLDESGNYLMALSGPDGQVYGSAWIKDNLLAVKIILGESGPNKAIEAEKPFAGGVLDEIKVEEGGITVTTREALDYLIGMSREDKLDMAPIVMVFSDSADAGVPARLVRDGAGWKAE